MKHARTIATVAVVAGVLAVARTDQVTILDRNAHFLPLSIPSLEAEDAR